MKTYGEVVVQLHTFLTSALDGGEQSVSQPIYFIPEESPWYPCKRKKARWDTELVWMWWQREYSLPLLGIITWLSSP
jgi:hypothetical protein